MTVADLNWKIAGVADFNGDGKADIFYRNDATGETYVYFMNGTSVTSAGFSVTVSALAWKIVGIGDLNGDGKADLLYRNDTTGETYI